MTHKLFKSKRGVVDEAGFWIFRILLIMIVVIALVFFVNSVILKNIDTGSLELDLVAARILNSPSCLAYEDSTNGRVYPGIINISNYDESYLKENCIITDKTAFVGVMIKLSDKDEIYLNKEYYEDTEPLTFSSKYVKVKKVLPVIVIDSKGKRENNILEVVVVARKR